MSILLVDHRDSFVNNLSAWFKAHSKNKVCVVDYKKLNKLNPKKFNTVIFSPGPGHPSEYVQSIEFYRELTPSVRFLGVCLGYQIMLYANGAQVCRVAATPIHGKQIKLGGVRSRILPAGAINGHFVLYNSLGIKTSDIIFKEKFTLLAAKNKFSLAAEHVFLPHIGVQFHPESFASPGGHCFLNSFIEKKMD